MDLRQHDDIIIPLRITDRRGRTIRARLCDKLQVRIWTQTPQQYISFYGRDILEKPEGDYIVVPDYEMRVLQPGVIVYRYSYRELMPDRRFGDYERAETVVTDLHWHGYHHDHLPQNPVNSHSIEMLKERMEDLYRDLTRQYKDLKRYIEKEYTDNLSEEILRAKDTEQKLGKSLEELTQKLEEEVKRSTDVDIRFLGELNKLEDSIKEVSKELSALSDNTSGIISGLTEEMRDTLGQIRKEFSKRMDETEESIRKEISAINDKVDEALIRRSLKESEQDQALILEVETRKKETDTLNTRIDNLKNLLNGTVAMLRQEIEQGLETAKHYAEDAKHYADDAVHALDDRIEAVSLTKIREWFK